GKERKRCAGSVLVGKQQRGHAAIPLSDDPELQVRRDLVGGEQPVFTGFEGCVVLLAIVLTQVSPVATEMATEVGAGIETPLLDEVGDAGSQDELSSRK